MAAVVLVVVAVAAAVFATLLVAVVPVAAAIFHSIWRRMLGAISIDLKSIEYA